MIKRAIAILTLLASVSAWAADSIVATVTITNAPALSGQTLVVNGSARTATNSQTATTFTTNATTIGGTFTNVFNQALAFPFTGLTLQYVSTNSFKLIGKSGAALTASISAELGTVTLSTNTGTDFYAVRVPLSGEQSGPRAYIASQLITGIMAYATNKWTRTAGPMEYFVDRDAEQSMTNKEIYASTFQGIMLNVTQQGGTNSFWMGNMTNGFWTNGIISGLTATNSTFYGGLSSIGAAGGQSYGPGANSSGAGVAVGQDATNSSGVSIGQEAEGNGGVVIGVASTVLNGVSVGNSTFASGDGAVVIGGGGSGTAEAVSVFGKDGSATAYRASAFAVDSSAGHTNSTAVGQSATTTKANEVMLGTASEHVAMPGTASVTKTLVVGSNSKTLSPSLSHGVEIVGSATAPSGNPTNAAAIWKDSNGFQYRTDATSEGAGQANYFHNRAEEVVGSGSDFSIGGTTYARVDFGGTDPQVALPTPGTYLIHALVSYDSGAVAGDAFYCKLYNSTDAADVADSEGHIETSGNNHAQMYLQALVTVTASKTIQIYAKNSTAARGAVESVHTKILYIRLY